MSITADLIKLIRSKPISDADLAAAAIFALDALAAAYAGSTTPVGNILLSWAKGSSMDSRREALLLGALTHITETDDLHRASVTHPGCVVVPVALVLGEQQKTTPREMLGAILHGYEAMCCIGAGMGPTHYKVWDNTATCGPYGSAMAAASILGLNDEQTLHALGNAGTQSSGFWQFMQTDAMSKHLHAGRAAESGWLAAEMAQYGFTGSPQILEGEKGMFAGMCADPQPDAILAQPDSAWQLLQTSIKPWPSCRHTHPTIDCALELHAQWESCGKPSIEHIQIDTYQAALDVCDRANPQNEYQAKFSLHHTVASALQQGEVTLNSFDQAAREQTAALRNKVDVKVVDLYEAAYPQSWGSSVAISLQDGVQLQASRQDCKGDPELILDEKQMRLKAQGLLQYSGLNEQQAATLCDQVLGLPNSDQNPSFASEFITKIIR